MRAPRRRAAARGFTLIEVIVALAIVVIGMSAVLGALSSSAGTIVYLRDKTFAQWVGLNQVATVRLAAQAANQVPQTGDSNGDVDDFAGRKWHWQQTISESQLPGVVRIDVSVRPADVKGDDKHGWYTTVTGMYGDSMGQARGDMPAWGTGTAGTTLTGAGGSPSGTLGSPGSGFSPPDSFSPSSTGGSQDSGGTGSSSGGSSSPSSSSSDTLPWDR